MNLLNASKKLTAAAMGVSLVCLSPGIEPYRIWADMAAPETIAVDGAAAGFRGLAPSVVTPMLGAGSAVNAGGSSSFNHATVLPKPVFGTAPSAANIGSASAPSPHLTSQAEAFPSDMTLISEGQAVPGNTPVSIRPTHELSEKISGGGASLEEVAAELDHMFENRGATPETAIIVESARQTSSRAATIAAAYGSKKLTSPTAANGVVGPRNHGVPLPGDDSDRAGKAKNRRVPDDYIPGYDKPAVVAAKVDELLLDARYTRAAKIAFLNDFYEGPSAAVEGHIYGAGGFMLLALLCGINAAIPVALGVGVASALLGAHQILQVFRYAKDMGIVKTGWEALHPRLPKWDGLPWHLSYINARAGRTSMRRLDERGSISFARRSPSVSRSKAKPAGRLGAGPIVMGAYSEAGAVLLYPVLWLLRSFVMTPDGAAQIVPVAGKLEISLVAGGAALLIFGALVNRLLDEKTSFGRKAFVIAAVVSGGAALLAAWPAFVASNLGPALSILLPVAGVMGIGMGAFAAFQDFRKQGIEYGGIEMFDIIMSFSVLFMAMLGPAAILGVALIHACAGLK